MFSKPLLLCDQRHNQIYSGEFGDGIMGVFIRGAGLTTSNNIRYRLIIDDELYTINEAVEEELIGPMALVGSSYFNYGTSYYFRNMLNTMDNIASGTNSYSNAIIVINTYSNHVYNGIEITSAKQLSKAYDGMVGWYRPNSYLYVPGFTRQNYLTTNMTELGYNQVTVHGDYTYLDKIWRHDLDTDTNKQMLFKYNSALGSGNVTIDINFPSELKPSGLPDYSGLTIHDVIHNGQLYYTILGYIPFSWDMSQDDYEHCLWNHSDFNSGTSNNNYSHDYSNRDPYGSLVGVNAGTNLYYFSKVPNVDL